MKRRNLFTSDLLDLDCESSAVEVRRACRVTAIEQADAGVISMKVPFEVVAKLRDEECYAPATAGKRKDATVQLRAYGSEVLRLTVVPEGEIAALDSPMLMKYPTLEQCKLTPEQTTTGWVIRDDHNQTRALIDNSTPTLNEWTGKPRQVIDALNLTLYPDGETKVPFNSVDRFDDFTYDSMPLSHVVHDGQVLRSGFALTTEYDEGFYGTGERFGRLDLSGQTLNLENTDGLGTNSRRTYKNVPLFLSSRPYGCFVHTSAAVRLSLADISTRSAQGAVPEPVLDLFIIGGSSLARILHNYRRLTGFPPMPPLWSFGTWMGRMSYQSAAEVRTVAKRLRDGDFPCDVLHIDTGWFPKDWVCDWKFSPERFPDPPGFLRELREQGFRVSLWQTPYIGKDNCRLAEAEAGGYLGKPRNVDNKTSGSDFSNQQVGGHIDFSNPAAVNWYQGLLRELLDMGVSAIKTDFGENIADADYSMPTMQLRNLYSLLYQRAAFEVTKEVTGDSLVWARAGWAGCQRYPVHWGGDAECSWQGMAGSLRGGLQLGLSGFAFWSHDVPGFHGTPEFMHSPPPDDLYVRWTQFGVFTSHLRYHGTSPREPYEFPAIAGTIRKWLKLRYALIPYLIRESKTSIANGLPLLRALILHAENDPVARRIEDQFFCGNDILVAPVMNAAGIRDVYLPPGTWVDLWTGQQLNGPQWLRGVNVPLEIMPVYVRLGASIPVYLEQVNSTADMDFSLSQIIKFGAEYKGLDSYL